MLWWGPSGEFLMFSASEEACTFGQQPKKYCDSDSMAAYEFFGNGAGISELSKGRRVTLWKSVKISLALGESHSSQAGFHMIPG